MANGDTREGKWRWNWRMELVASTVHTTSENGVSSITIADAQTSAASSRLNWHLNGLVHFAERQNLDSVCVPSHFKRNLEEVVAGEKQRSWEKNKDQCQIAHHGSHMMSLWTEPDILQTEAKVHLLGLQYSQDHVSYSLPELKFMARCSHTNYK